MPRGSHDDSEDGTARIRNLLRCAAGRVKSTGSSGANFWKEIFEKYDSDRSGLLGFGELRYAVRKDLRLSQNAVSDPDLKKLFDRLDVDDSGSLTFEEFLNYVQTGKQPGDEVKERQMLEKKLLEVQRAMRNAFARMRIRRPEQVYEVFREFDKDGDSQLTLSELSVFMRKQLKLSKYELPERALKMVFDYLDADKSQFVTADELIGFLNFYKDKQEENLYGYKRKSGRLRLSATALQALRKSPRGSVASLHQGGLDGHSASLSSREMERLLRPSIAFSNQGRQAIPMIRMVATGGGTSWLGGGNSLHKKRDAHSSSLPNLVSQRKSSSPEKERDPRQRLRPQDKATSRKARGAERLEEVRLRLTARGVDCSGFGIRREVF